MTGCAPETEKYVGSLRQRRRWAIEIKLTANPSPADLTRLSTAADLIKADRRFLVSRTTEIVSDARQASCNLPWLLQLMESQGG
jgi:hypothetical protein